MPSPARHAHAPVPAADCGQPLALVAELLPAGARFDCEVIPAPGVQAGHMLDHLNGFFGPLGLPTDRLVVKPGMWLFLDGETPWLAVDFIVPGTRNAADNGWDVALNAEAGRAAPEDRGAREAALDRWVVQLVDGLPDFLEASR